MNGRVAKKLRREVSRLKKQMILDERKKVADSFRKFINSLNWWNRLKLCKEIMRKKF